MNASELRTGNLVLCNDQVCEVDYMTTHQMHFDQAHGKACRFSPIPITPEWLEKLGFEKDNTPGCWVNNNFILFEINDSVVLGKDEPREGYYYSGGLKFITHIKHIHQLQNLYFALTGQELTVKEMA